MFLPWGYGVGANDVPDRQWKSVQS